METGRSRAQFRIVLIWLAVVCQSAMFANAAQAQTHGFSVVNNCTSPVRVCDSDTDCSDGNECTTQFCDDDTFPLGTLECTWTVRNDDGYGDTLSIVGSFETVNPFTAENKRIPAVGDAPIVAASGNTTCVIGPFQPCTIGPDLGSGPGEVSFRNTPGYNPSDTDPSPLIEQTTVLWEDLCDGLPSVDCGPYVGGPLSYGATTTLVNGCSEPEPVVCSDGDACTDDACDANTGACVHLPADPLPAECAGAEICRTPGFWGARGGDEKAPKSQNITQAVIDAAGGLDVCGTTIVNTDLGSDQSAIEAICVAVKGDSSRQLVRQLTAAALNCVLGDCTAYHADLVADCNDTCADDTGARTTKECIDELDCFNSGGTWDSGMCAFPGTCDLSGDACVTDEGCPDFGDYCVPRETCHDRDLCPDLTDDEGINVSDFCFEPPGPASSSGKCNAARKNNVHVP